VQIGPPVAEAAVIAHDHGEGDAAGRQLRLGVGDDDDHQKESREQSS
jgi:hypothetical protein